MKKLVVALVALWPALALSETPCKTDADCGPGAWCVHVPCAMTCSSDEPCEPTECDTSGYCEEFEPPTWTASECAADADCPSGFKCVEQEQPCASPAICKCAPCPDDTECPCECEAQPPCEPKTVKMCTYEFTECAEDSACPEGFECHLIEECSTSGGVGCGCPGCAPGEECEPCECPPPEPAPEPECKTYGGVCAPKQMECTSAADCPSGWECAEVGGYAGGGSAGGGTDCVCASCPPDSTCEPCECEGGGSSGSSGSGATPPPPPEGAADDESGDDDDLPEGSADMMPVEEEPAPVAMYCLPAGWADAVQNGDFSGGSVGAASDAAAEMGLPGVPKDGSNEDAPPVQPGPAASDGDEQSGGTSDSSTHGTGSGGGASGCSATPAAGGPGALLGLLLCGLLAVVLRRRSIAG